MVKTRQFSYKKKDGEEREVKLLVLNESDTHMNGIDLSKLGQDEVCTVKVIQREYEKELKPYMNRAFRNFIKESVVGEIKEEVEKI